MLLGFKICQADLESTNTARSQKFTLDWIVDTDCQSFLSIRCIFFCDYLNASLFNYVVTILLHQYMLLYLHVVNCSYSFYDTLSKLSVPLSLGNKPI